MNSRFSIKHMTSTKSDENNPVPKKKCTAIIKVTDDKRTVTYHTTERAAAKRIARMTRWFITRMSTADPVEQADPSSLKQPLMH